MMEVSEKWTRCYICVRCKQELNFNEFDQMIKRVSRTMLKNSLACRLWALERWLAWLCDVCYIIQMENICSTPLWWWWSVGNLSSLCNVLGGITEKKINEIRALPATTHQMKKAFFILFCYSNREYEVGKMRVERWYELCKIIRLMWTWNMNMNMLAGALLPNKGSRSPSHPAHLTFIWMPRTRTPRKKA